VNNSNYSAFGACHYPGLNFHPFRCPSGSQGNDYLEIDKGLLKTYNVIRLSKKEGGASVGESLIVTTLIILFFAFFTLLSRKAEQEVDRYYAEKRNAGKKSR
jgi:hypothetical protein